MGREEQKEEREVLDSIFPDEIIDVSETEYRISVALDVDKSDEDESEAPIIILRVSYPKDYPNVAPDLDLLSPPNASSYEDLDVQGDKDRLLESLQPSIEENMGMAMIFALVSTLKDNAELLIAERQQAAQALLDVEKAKAEEEENKKFHGTAVTRESFLQWRENFVKEMIEEERKKQEEKEVEDKNFKKKVPEKARNLTGRELWERGIARGESDDEDDDDDDDGVAQQTKELKIEG